MNKTLTSWLSVVVVFALCLPLYAWNGSGTYEDPYEIATASDVADLVQAVNGGASQSGVYFLQTADIDLSTFGNFTPIGSASAPFVGNYDGDGYILSNLTITASVSGATTNAFGLFGYVEEATIENVSVYGKVNVLADYNASACVGVGGVIGISVKGLFAGLQNHCDLDVKISNAPTGIRSDVDIKYGVGGVVGLNAWTTNSGTTHIGCENYGDVYVDGVNGACAVGGCFSANIPNSGTYTTFSGWNNFGKVIVKGTEETSTYYPAVASGVGAIHWYIGSGSTSRTPNFVGCSNWGNIICSNSVCEAGVAANARGNQSHVFSASYCTNYGEIAYVGGSTSVRNFIGGVASGISINLDDRALYCVNLGKIKAKGNGSTYPQIGGVFSFHHSGNNTTEYSYGNKNFGDIEADFANVITVAIGGVGAAIRKILLRRSENYGNISVNTDGSVLIGGVASQTDKGLAHGCYSDCVNFGNIVASGNNNTNYSPCVGGVFASTRLTDNNTRNITISNCYNLGSLKLNLNSDGCYGAIYGVANTYGNYSVSIKNCYALMGEGQSLIGAVNAENGSVILENCVGIVNGLNGGIAASVVGSNNWSQANTTIATYNDCYHNPSLCLGNMFSGTFFPAEKSTNYFDLILPINTTLFATPSASDKKNHNWTKANGYKRYITTIQNNQ